MIEFVKIVYNLFFHNTHDKLKFLRAQNYNSLEFRNIGGVAEPICSMTSGLGPSGYGHIILPRMGGNAGLSGAVGVLRDVQRYMEKIKKS